MPASRLWSPGRNPRRPGALGLPTTTRGREKTNTTPLQPTTRGAEVVEVVVPAAEAGVEDVVEESLITSSTKFRRHVPYGECKFALVATS